MKSMKIASAAMLAMVGLGFAASPASAATDGVDQSTATVTISAGNELKIISVPNFSFTSSVQDEGKYAIEATQKGTEGNETIGDMKVFRNYAVAGEGFVKNKVQAKIGKLSYNTQSGPRTVNVTSFDFNGVENEAGTGVTQDIFYDSAFTAEVSGQKNRYTAKINSAKIKFTDSSIGLQGRTLTGKIVYTVTNVNN